MCMYHQHKLFGFCAKEIAWQAAFNTLDWHVWRSLHSAQPGLAMPDWHCPSGIAHLIVCITMFSIQIPM